MRTIETAATVGLDGKLILQLPSDIQPGEHQLVLVIEEQPTISEKHSLPEFPIIEVMEWPENVPLRREDLEVSS